jgi:hypothetical protein
MDHTVWFPPPYVPPHVRSLQAVPRECSKPSGGLPCVLRRAETNKEARSRSTTRPPFNTPTHPTTAALRARVRWKMAPTGRLSQWAARERIRRAWEFSAPTSSHGPQAASARCQPILQRPPRSSTAGIGNPSGSRCAAANHAAIAGTWRRMGDVRDAYRTSPHSAASGRNPVGEVLARD